MDEPQPPSPFAPNPNSPFGQPQGAPAASPYGPPPGAPPAGYGPPPGAPPAGYGPPQGPPPGHNPYAQAPPGQPHNPYAAPVSDGGPSWGMGMEEHGILASRGSRFLGSLLDGLVFMLALIPMFLIIGIGVGVGGAGGDAGVLAGVTTMLCILLIVGIQWYLISTTGQSIAKRLLGMKIIKTNGEDVNFVSGVVLRVWVPALIGAVPAVGAFFPIIDALFIFGDEQQCLHDKIAGTKVISL